MLSDLYRIEAENEAERLFKKGKQVAESKFLEMSSNAFPSVKKICLEQHDYMVKHYIHLQNQPTTKQGKNGNVFSKIK